MLQGQIALVTGASRGIGQACALELGRQGAAVIGTATSENGAQAISQYLADNQIKGVGIKLNVNDASEIECALTAIRAQFGEVSILVNNNAGITRDNLLMRMKEAEWDDIIETHYDLYGEFTGVRTARKHIGWYVKSLPGGEAFRARA